MTSSPFASGTMVVRRDALNGRVWTAAAHHVLHDDGNKLVLATWPGTVGYTPTNWIRWFTTGDAQARNRAVADPAGDQWKLGRWIGHDTFVITWVGCG